jgi:hypothetical protein
MLKALTLMSILTSNTLYSNAVLERMVDEPVNFINILDLTHIKQGQQAGFSYSTNYYKDGVYVGYKIQTLDFPKSLRLIGFNLQIAIMGY